MRDALPITEKPYKQTKPETAAKTSAKIDIIC